jgi:hypothetical protein
MIFSETNAVQRSIDEPKISSVLSHSESQPAAIACLAFLRFSCTPGLPGFADTEGVGVTQYPLMYKPSGDLPRIQQAFVDKSVENPMVLPDRRSGFPSRLGSGTFQFPSSQGLPVSAENKGKRVTQYACPLTRHTTVPGVGKPDPAKEEDAGNDLFHH